MATLPSLRLETASNATGRYHRVESRFSDVACRPGIFFFLNNIFPYELWNNSLHESSFIAIIPFTLEMYSFKENRHLFRLRKKKGREESNFFITRLGENIGILSRVF